MRLRLFLIMLAALVMLALFFFLRSRQTTAPPRQAESVSGILGERSHDEGYARAYTVRPFSFPADHGPHPGFRTEWWYFTGNLESGQGRRFGYQLTFFRFALAAKELPRESRWGTSEAFMTHFALTDVKGGRFHFAERFSRGALGLAGAQGLPMTVHLEDWSAREISARPFGVKLQASEGDMAIKLSLRALTPEILNGDDGLSRKSGRPGNASYYYSLPRMESSGEISISGERFRVSGLSWLDREWSTSALERNQVGWDWFALQLDDGRCVMFYQLRRSDGSADPFSSGTLVSGNGNYRHLAQSAVKLHIEGWWVSPTSGVRYPSRWRLLIPEESLDLEIVPRLAAQELNASFRYWEGAVAVKGVAAGSPNGSGYLEMTGYGKSNR